MGVSAREGQSWAANPIGTPMLGVDANGQLAPITLSSGDGVATNEVHVPAAATAAVLTYAADTGVAHGLWEITYSYSAAPTGGRLTVTDGASDVVLDIDITAAGPNQLIFPKGKLGTAGRSMVVTLASGAGAVVGKLNASHYTVTVSAGGVVNFGDEMNSGLMGLFF